MSRDTILQLELRLLVARYGKRRILSAIATIEGVDLVEIEREIERQEVKAKRKKKRRSKGISELIQEARLSDIDARPFLEELALRFDAKEFLPQLRDVKRFLESRGVPAGKLRSRLNAMPKVVDVLASLSSAELKDLMEELLTSGRGDLGIISDQILGRRDRDYDA